MLESNSKQQRAVSRAHLSGNVIEGDLTPLERVTCFNNMLSMQKQVRVQTGQVWQACKAGVHERLSKCCVLSLRSKGLLLALSEGENVNDRGQECARERREKQGSRIETVCVLADL